MIKTKRKRPQINHRIAVFRMNEVAKMILRGHGANCRTMARELETSVRTIMRDVDFLRDFLRHEIAWDNKERTYWYVTPPLSLMDPKRKGLI